MPSSSEVRLSREMRLVDVTMIGVGAMIGAGIFVLTGIAAGVSGPGLIVVFLLNGLVTLFAAAAYAELGSCFHEAGGGYLYVKQGLKDPQGFMSGWMAWFAYVVACALYALGFGAYLKEVLPVVGLQHFQTPFLPMEKWMAVLVVVAFCYINYRGASEAGGAGNIVTAGKILVLIVFIGFGIWATLRQPDWQARFLDDPLPNGFGSIFVAMGLTFIAFEGYEIIAQCSEEVQNPARNIPKAIFLSLLIVVPIYLLVAFVAIGAVQTPEGMPTWEFLGLQKETALVDVARSFFKGGGIMILIGGLLSTMSALNATIYSSSRVSLAMGRDRNLPAFFAGIHERCKTPHWAILVSGLLTIFMAVALPIETVASAANILFLLLFIQVLAAVITLRKKRPDLHRGFKVPWVPVIPILGIIAQLALAVYLFVYSPMGWLSAGIWIGLGLGVFYGYSRRRDRSYAQMVEVRQAAERRDYRILVAIGNPRTAPTVLGAAASVARHYDGELIALTVVEVDEHEGLAQGLNSVAEAQEQLAAILVDFKADGLPIKTVVKISHRISYGIIETALEEKCNLIVTGRPRKAGFLERFAATAVDRVVRSAPAQVMVVSADRWPKKIDRVLFPFATGPNSQLTADFADALAGVYQGRVRAVHIVSPNASSRDHLAAEKRMAHALGERHPDAERIVVPHTDIINGLIHEAREADLVVIGGTEAGLLEQLLGYALPLELADRTSKPVITVYEMSADPKRWLKN
ncbi:MAG: amino acid permease [Opitutaceae bacterium]